MIETIEWLNDGFMAAVHGARTIKTESKWIKRFKNDYQAGGRQPERFKTIGKRWKTINDFKTIGND